MASLESRPVRTKSDSSVQRHVEEIVRASLQTNLGLSTPVVKRKFKLGSSWVEVDCFAEADGVVFLAEINAHHGLMKTSTRNKVLKDILKMSVLEKAM